MGFIYARLCLVAQLYAHTVLVSEGVKGGLKL
jgi:hypothetical protein